QSDSFDTRSVFRGRNNLRHAEVRTRALFPFPRTTQRLRSIIHPVRYPLRGRQGTARAVFSLHDVAFPSRFALSEVASMFVCSRRSYRVLLLACCTALLPASQAPAQPPTLAPNPQAPNLAMPFPMGAKRGGPIELALTGTNLADPTAFWTSFPAKVTIPTDNNNGKDHAKLRVLLDIPAAAPL